MLSIFVLFFPNVCVSSKASLVPPHLWIFLYFLGNCMQSTWGLFSISSVSGGLSWPFGPIRFLGIAADAFSFPDAVVCYPSFRQGPITWSLDDTHWQVSQSDPEHTCTSLPSSRWKDSGASTVQGTITVSGVPSISQSWHDTIFSSGSVVTCA